MAGRRGDWIFFFILVAPDDCGSSIWSLLHITISSPCILRWLLDFFENLCTRDTGWYLGTTLCQYINWTDKLYPIQVIVIAVGASDNVTQENDLVRIGYAVGHRLRNVNLFFFFVSQSLGFLVIHLLLLLVESQTVSFLYFVGHISSQFFANDQLDELLYIYIYIYIFIYIYLYVLYLPTCSKHHSAHHQEIELY